MSRYEIAARDPEQKVIVGWDHPLLTFFVQVINIANEEAGDDDNKVVMWRGTSMREVYDVDKLARLVAPYASLSSEMRSTLYGDKDDGK